MKSLYKPIEIIIADDHEIFRDGFALMVKHSPEIKLVGEASNGKDLVKLALKLNPDVIVTDVNMPQMDGIEATKEILKELPHTAILALSMYNEEEYIIPMLEAGAKGYAVKNTSKFEIVDAIKTINAGQNYYCRQTTHELLVVIARSRFKPAFTGIAIFSDIEIGIIKLICKQFSNKEIADKLDMKQRTVEWTRQHIAKKMKVQNTAGIVIYAIRHNIIKL